jgi:hypothetical protein
MPFRVTRYGGSFLDLDDPENVDSGQADPRSMVPALYHGFLVSRQDPRPGLRCIEAGTDTECDPLYMGPGYIRDWVEEVRVRDRFHHDWLKALLQMAEKLDAGSGFFCHAFSDSRLQKTEEYAGMMSELIDRFSDLAEFADLHGNTTIGVEQKYTPHQVPWTIDGAIAMIREVHRKSRKPFISPSTRAIKRAQESASSSAEKPLCSRIRQGYFGRFETQSIHRRCGGIG